MAGITINPVSFYNFPGNNDIWMYTSTVSNENRLRTLREKIKVFKEDPRMPLELKKTVAKLEANYNYFVRGLQVVDMIGDTIIPEPSKRTPLEEKRQIFFRMKYEEMKSKEEMLGEQIKEFTGKVAETKDVIRLMTFQAERKAGKMASQANKKHANKKF